MKIKFFIIFIISATLSVFFNFTGDFSTPNESKASINEDKASKNEDKRISPWNVENVHAKILGQWKLEGYYEDNKLVTNYEDKNLIWNITDKEISFNCDELGKGTTEYNIRRTIYRIFPTMLILTDPDVNLFHGKFIVENVNSTKLELVDWNDEVRFNLTRISNKEEN